MSPFYSLFLQTAFPHIVAHYCCYTICPTPVVVTHYQAHSPFSVLAYSLGCTCLFFVFFLLTWKDTHYTSAPITCLPFPVTSPLTDHVYVVLVKSIDIWPTVCTAEEEGETPLSGTTGRQRRRGGAWKGVAQPFTAAGVGPSLAAAQDSTSSSAAAQRKSSSSSAAAAATGISRWGFTLDACLWRGRLQQRKKYTAATAPAVKRTYNPCALLLSFCCLLVRISPSQPVYIIAAIKLS